MKKLAFAALAACIVLSCMAPPAETDRNLENEALQTKYVDAIVNGRVDELGTFLADNYKGYGPAVADSTDKAGEIAGWKAQWDSTYSSISYDRYAILSSTVGAEGRIPGDWVMDWGIVTLNYKSGGAPVKFWFHSVNRYKDGKLDLSRSFYDVNDILKQRGFTQVPPAAM
jgi:hypothetical protein